MTEHLNEAIVVNRLNYSESDVIVRMWVKGEGEVGVFMRSARKSGYKRGVNLPPFSHIKVNLSRKPGSGLYSLKSKAEVYGPKDLVSNYEKQRMCTILLKMVEVLGAQADPEIFNTLTSAIKEIDINQKPEPILLASVFLVLVQAGLDFDLHRDVNDVQLLAENNYSLDDTNNGLRVDARGPFNSNHIKFLRLISQHGDVCIARRFSFDLSLDAVDQIGRYARSQVN